MEYMPNRSVDHILKQVKEGNPPDFWNDTGIVTIVCGIVVGMEFIHSRGMVYRDLKPANILLDAAGRIRIAIRDRRNYLKGRLLCLGITRDEPMSSTRNLWRRSLHREDQCFSFALILDEILVGRPVYPARLSEVQIMKKVCNKIRADLPSSMNDEVKTLITRCWSGKVNDRLSFSEILA
jgi:serine/threonine protein kinase